MAGRGGSSSAAAGLANPHMPEFLAKVPWWFNAADGAAPGAAPGADGSLPHQRKAEAAKDAFGFSTYYRRGEFGARASSYRKGACKNCGAMTHDAKSCVERPRALGAWKTSAAIAPDELVQPVGDLSYDAKRDRWNGYDPDEHMRTVALYEAAEATRTAQREEAKRASAAAAKSDGKHGVDEDASTGSDSDFTSSDEGDAEDDGVRAVDSAADTTQGIAVKGTKTKMSVRNLRVREDRAKYLINLDVDSAYYDPKTRSMREDPHVGSATGASAADALYRGDNAWRGSGLVGDMVGDQVFAWDAAAQGAQVHMQAAPTQLELLKRRFAERKAALDAATGEALQAKYVQQPDAAAAQSQSVHAATVVVLDDDDDDGHAQRFKSVQPVTVEVDARVRELPVAQPPPVQVVPPSAAVRVVSRYAETAPPGNHSSVFGSWYDVQERRWGFACCHSTLASSYCSGQAGKEAIAAARRFKSDSAEAAAAAAAHAAASTGSSSSSSSGAMAAAAAERKRRHESEERRDELDSVGQEGGRKRGRRGEPEEDTT